MASYPSDHSTLSTLMAAMLPDLRPEYLDAMFARAATCAGKRVIGGVHDRSDIVAGRTSGASIALGLEHDETFLRDSVLPRDARRQVPPTP